VNTSNGVNWRRLIVPKKVDQINDTSQIKIKVGVNDIIDMTVNNSEMCVR